MQHNTQQAKKTSSTPGNVAPQPASMQPESPEAVRSRNSQRKAKEGAPQAQLPSSDRNEGATAGSISSEFNGENDAFNRHYNKELRVSKEEIPIVLAELNDSAYQFIKREQFEKALNLLQKAYGIMDVIDFSSCRRDRFQLFVMFHNMALCYQKMQMLEECASCIDQALEQMPPSSFGLEERKISNRMRKLGIVSRLQMQFCAILSQIHRHKDALEQAREAVRLNHLILNDLRSLCHFYIKREDFVQQQQSLLAGGGPSQSDKHSHSMSTSQQQNPRRNQNNLADNSYTSVNSLPGMKSKGQRNKSFSSFLSMQEEDAYGGNEMTAHNQSHALYPQQNSSLTRHGQSVQSTHSLSSFASVNQLEQSMSYIERTARKLLPILTELKKRMVPEKRKKKNVETDPHTQILYRDRSATDDMWEMPPRNEKGELLLDEEGEGIGEKNDVPGLSKHQATDMKNILGYLNQGEWTSKLSIGSIMQLQPYKFKDLIEEGQNELELTRDSFIKKVSNLTVSYFCYSTEIRFIIQMKEDMKYDTPIKQRESEYWHAKSLEIACTLLPGECPLLNHINVSYNKHFAPVKTAIKEDESNDDGLQVIKPLNGVDNNKFQPIVRRLDNVHIAITPYSMTPLNQVTNQVINQFQSFNEFQTNPPPIPQNQQSSSNSILNPSDSWLKNERGERGGSLNPKSKQALQSISENPLNSQKDSQQLDPEESLRELKSVHQKSVRDDQDNGGETDDMMQLEGIFKRLVQEGKVSRKQLIQKLLQVTGGRVVSTSSANKSQLGDRQRSSSMTHTEDIQSIKDEEDCLVEESISQVSGKNFPLRQEDQRHNLKSNPTNSSFQKFKAVNQAAVTSQDFIKVQNPNNLKQGQQIHHTASQQLQTPQPIAPMRPKSSKGGIRSSASTSVLPTSNQVKSNSVSHQHMAIGPSTTQGSTRLRNQSSKLVQSQGSNHGRSNVDIGHSHSVSHMSAERQLLRKSDSQNKTTELIKPSSGNNQLAKAKSQARPSSSKLTTSSKVPPSVAINNSINVGRGSSGVATNPNNISIGPQSAHNATVFERLQKKAQAAQGQNHNNSAVDKTHLSPQKNDLSALERKYLQQANGSGVDQSNHTVSAHHPPGSKVQTDLLAGSHHQPQMFKKNHPNGSQTNTSAQNRSVLLQDSSQPQNQSNYDELKKRLLNEYKKLQNAKKPDNARLTNPTSQQQHSIQTQVKPKSQQNASRILNQSNGEIVSDLQPVSQGSGQTGNQTGPNGASSNSASNQQHLMNVYKPTFIINNSFSQQNNESGGQPSSSSNPGQNSNTAQQQLQQQSSNQAAPASVLQQQLSQQAHRSGKVSGPPPQYVSSGDLKQPGEVVSKSKSSRQASNQTAGMGESGTTNGGSKAHNTSVDEQQRRAKNASHMMAQHPSSSASVQFISQQYKQVLTASGKPSSTSALKVQQSSASQLHGSSRDHQYDYMQGYRFANPSQPQPHSQQQPQMRKTKDQQTNATKQSLVNMGHSSAQERALVYEKLKKKMSAQAHNNSGNGI